jgi:hypothetical protein
VTRRGRPWGAVTGDGCGCWVHDATCSPGQNRWVGVCACLVLSHIHLAPTPAQPPLVGPCLHCCLLIVTYAPPPPAPVPQLLSFPVAPVATLPWKESGSVMATVADILALSRFSDTPLQSEVNSMLTLALVWVGIMVALLLHIASVVSKQHRLMAWPAKVRVVHASPCFFFSFQKQTGML